MSKALFYILGNLGSKLATWPYSLSYSFWYFPRQEVGSHPVPFLPTSTWVTTGLGKHHKSGLLPSYTVQKFEYKNQTHTERHTHKCSGMVILPWWYALMFIGTGACRDRIRHFDDARSGSQERERRGPDEREMQEGEGDCFSLAPHAIQGKKRTHFGIPAWALFPNYSHSQALSIRTWPWTSLWTSQLSVCKGLTLVPLSAAICVLQRSCLDSSSDVLTPTMRGLLIAVESWRETDAATEPLLNGGGGWSGKSLGAAVEIAVLLEMHIVSKVRSQQWAEL